MNTRIASELASRYSEIMNIWIMNGLDRRETGRRWGILKYEALSDGYPNDTHEPEQAAES